MGTPDLLVDISFVSDPLTPNASTTWVDVSQYVRGKLTTRRGRNHERAEFEAGTAILTLSNTDRRFDPTNTAGPYYGYVKPWRKIRIRARWPNTTGTITAIWAGYVEAWRPSYGQGNDATVTIECVDAIKLFNLYVLESSALNEQRSDLRIGVVLNGIGWASADRNLDAGDVRVAASTGLVVNGLQHMQDCARTEGGAMFIGRTGGVRFEKQSLRAGIVGPYLLFTDDPAGAGNPYAELELSNDDTHIWNYITVTRVGGLTQYAREPSPFPSETSFGLHRLDITGTLHINDTEAGKLAELTLARYKDARTRVQRMVIDPAVRNVWANTLGLDISVVISVQRSGLLGGSQFNQDNHIESVSWSIEKGRWLLTLQLSPRVTNTPAAPTLVMGTRWLAPTSLLNGWQQLAGDTPVGYRKDAQGWVYLRGGVDGSAVSGPIIFQLPADYRPPYTQQFVVYSTTSAGSGPSINTLSVDTSGNVTHLSGVPYVRLNQVSFRIT